MGFKPIAIFLPFVFIVNLFVTQVNHPYILLHLAISKTNKTYK